MITNNLNMPDAFLAMATETEDYAPTPKRYSATTLLKSVREIILKRRHYAELEQDVADMIWLLFGQAVHYILEKYGRKLDGMMCEEFLQVPVEDGYTISGRIDYFDPSQGLIVDYKTASTWKFKMKDWKDWKQQGATYAWLLWKCGYEVKKVQFWAIFKDWSKSKAKYDRDYPPMACFKYEFDVTPELLAETDAMLRAKLAEVRVYEDVPDEELPMCTAEERWNKGDKYAVMKDTPEAVKKKREAGTTVKAMKVCDTREEAEEYMKAKGGNHIEGRPGEDTKCNDYCASCSKCDYWRGRYGS